MIRKSSEFIKIYDNTFWRSAGVYLRVGTTDEERGSERGIERCCPEAVAFRGANAAHVFRHQRAVVVFGVSLFGVSGWRAPKDTLTTSYVCKTIIFRVESLLNLLERRYEPPWFRCRFPIGHIVTRTREEHVEWIQFALDIVAEW